MAATRTPPSGRSPGGAPPKRRVLDPDAARRRAITRRMFLAVSGSLALGAVVCTGAAKRAWWARPPGEGRLALSDDEYEIVQAVAEAWMPAGEPAPTISGAEADCGAFVDEVVARMTPDQARLFKLMLHLLDELPRAVEFRPFRKLDIGKRAQHIELWLGSPIFYHRQGVSALLALVALGYTSHPEVAPHFARYFGCGFGR